MFKTAYKIEDGILTLGSFKEVPNDFTAYTIGKEPTELKLMQEKEAKEEAEKQAFQKWKNGLEEEKEKELRKQFKKQR